MSRRDACPETDEPDEDERRPLGQVVFVEPARSYASAWVFLGVLLAGFCFDIYLGGAVTHLPGWLIATVLVVGADLLLIYAARSTRSLTLTTDELWVGDEMLPRPDVVGAAEGVVPGAPVLGWPNAIPRRVKGVSLRLVDDRDVVVPTRNAARLLAALGVGAIGLPQAATVREAGAADLGQLAEIDERAEVLFRLAGYDLPSLEFDDDLDAARAIFVYADPPVAFVRVDEVDGLAHLAEIAVLPGAMRKGIGSALIEHACTWAADQGYPAVTLTTFAEVPWNGPYYTARGFVEVDGLTPGLAARRTWEAEVGLDAVGRRIAMRRELDARS